MHLEPKLPRTYRPNVVVRVLGVALVVASTTFIFFGVGLLLLSEGEQPVPIGAAVMSLLTFVGIAGWCASASRVRITVSHAGVEVVNILTHHRFTWSEIERFEVGFAWLGITLIRGDGSRLFMTAINKNAISLALREHTRADEVVERSNCILSVEVLSAGMPAPLPPPPGSRP